MVNQNRVKYWIKKGNRKDIAIKLTLLKKVSFCKVAYRIELHISEIWDTVYAREGSENVNNNVTYNSSLSFQYSCVFCMENTGVPKMNSSWNLLIQRLTYYFTQNVFKKIEFYQVISCLLCRIRKQLLIKLFFSYFKLLTNQVEISENKYLESYLAVIEMSRSVYMKKFVIHDTIVNIKLWK